MMSWSFVSGVHGITAPGADWWIMQFRSPDLSGSVSWQNAAGYQVRFAECMGSGGSDLYANCFVEIWNPVTETTQFFFNGNAQPMVHDVYSDAGSDYNTCTINWLAAPGFPSHYTVVRVQVNIRAQLTTAVEGGVYLDEVIPTPAEAITRVFPTPLEVGLVEGGMLAEILILRNSGEESHPAEVSAAGQG